MRYSVSLLLFLASACTFALGAGNPYAAAGILNPTDVAQFLVRLKDAVARRNMMVLMRMIEYPLKVYDPVMGSRTYRNSSALRSHYAQVFTPEVVEAITAAQPGKLFSRDQGVMLGSGEVWMTERNGVMKVITINHTH